MTRTAIHINLLVFLLAAFSFNPHTNEVLGNVGKGVFLSLATRPQADRGGDADTLQAVHVSTVLNLPVVQQPDDDPYYVSNRNGEVTQFGMASQYGNIGLLAHNTLSGRSFSKLSVGQEVHLIYGDGRVEYYVIVQILRFQALEPESISSSFENLDGDEVLSANEMFNRAYGGDRRLVFQTCIAAEGNVSWGRLFVIAVPRP